MNDDDLFHQLRRIKRISEEEKTSHCDIGFLTTLPRNEWAQARNELMKDSINRDSLDVIERSIFVVCLDSAEKSTENKRKSVNGSNGHSERNGFHHENGNACESDEGNHKNGKYAEISDTEIALEMLHGRGSQFNSGNRWYDKTIQVRIVSVIVIFRFYFTLFIYSLLFRNLVLVVLIMNIRHLKELLSLS